MAMQDEKPEGESDNIGLKIAGAVVALLVLLGLGYGAFAYFSSSSNLNEYKAATADMSMEKITVMKPEERKEYFENIRNLREKMSDSEKKQADEISRDKRETQMKEKMTAFFALPPAEKKAALDKDVDRMASMMKAFGGAGGKGPGGAAGGPGAGGAGRGQGGQAGAGAGAGGAGAGFGAGGAGAGGFGAGGPRGNPNATPEEKNKRTSDRLDNSSPETRAQMTEYFKLVGERAKERGIQMPNFGGGGATKGR